MLVFGDANGFRPRDEFTIDFEGLDRGVCATLDAFLDDVTLGNARAAVPSLPKVAGATPAPAPADASLEPIS